MYWNRKNKNDKNSSIPIQKRIIFSIGWLAPVRGFFTKNRKAPAPSVISCISPGGNQVNPRLTLLCTQVGPVHRVQEKKKRGTSMRAKETDYSPARDQNRREQWQKGRLTSSHTFLTMCLGMSVRLVRTNEVDRSDGIDTIHIDDIQTISLSKYSYLGYWYRY